MTVITFPVGESSTAHPHIRRFSLYRDLKQVANLIELAFADTMDMDGRRYVSQMRSAANHPKFLNWASGLAARASMPFNGFVWEQDGRVVGNLSQIPMHRAGKKIYLIANVAVHPEFRGQGIARMLTQASLNDLRQRGSDETWLHVREDNAPAVNLYRSAGFVEHTRRTNWYTTPAPRTFPAESPPAIVTRPRRADDWPSQAAWIDQLHPSYLRWYLPLDPNTLRPGLLGLLHRFVSGADARQWSAVRGGQLLGVLSWVSSTASYDRLWLAANPAHEEEAASALLAALKGRISRRKPLNLEYPAGRAEAALQSAGFTPHHTLIWMRYKK